MAEDLSVAVISAGAALLGSLVGGVISYFTTKDATLRQWKQSLVLRELERKEMLYSDFIGECAKLLLGALDKQESAGLVFANLYTLLGKIRMMSSMEVRTAAEALAKHCTDAHFQRGKKDGTTGDFVFDARNRFTEIARTEIDELRKSA
jgi:hypothetical protein